MFTKVVKYKLASRNFHYYFFSWRDSPPVDLGLFLIHEDICGF